MITRKLREFLFENVDLHCALCYYSRVIIRDAVLQAKMELTKL